MVQEFVVFIDRLAAAKRAQIQSPASLSSTYGLTVGVSLERNCFLLKLMVER